MILAYSLGLHFIAVIPLLPKGQLPFAPHGVQITWPHTDHKSLHTCSPGMHMQQCCIGTYQNEAPTVIA